MGLNNLEKTSLDSNIGIRGFGAKLDRLIKDAIQEGGAVYAGAWAAGAYNVNDIVTHSGSAYIASAATTAGDEPGVAAVWVVLGGGGGGGGSGFATGYKITLVTAAPVVLTEADAGLVIFAATQSVTLPDAPADGTSFRMYAAGPFVATINTAGSDVLSTGGTSLAIAYGQYYLFTYLAGFNTWNLLPLQPASGWNVDANYQGGEIVNVSGKFFVAKLVNIGLNPTDPANFVEWSRIDTPRDTAEYIFTSAIPAGGSLAEIPFHRVNAQAGQAGQGVTYIEASYVPSENTGAASDTDYVTITISKRDLSLARTVLATITSTVTGPDSGLGGKSAWMPISIGNFNGVPEFLSHSDTLTIEVTQTAGGLELPAGIVSVKGVLV